MKTIFRHYCILSAIFCSLSFAAIWYVHPDSTLNSVQTALNLCADNDTVLVASGIYTETIVWPNTQGIDLISEPGTPDSTILQPSSTNSVISVEYTIDTTTVINGFTIRDGQDYGGIYLLGASPLINNNVIIDNQPFAILQIHGAGIYCDVGSAPLITNNIIRNNYADAEIAYGGGIYCIQASPIIIDNIIDNNGAGFYWSGAGAGILCTDSSSPFIRKNTITDNYAYSPLHGYCGAGIICRNGSSPYIDSCIITNYLNCGVRSMADCNPVIHYCNIYGHPQYGVRNGAAGYIINAEYNWWGDSTGPYHPDSNPGGLGDPVSDYVDFIPWLDNPVGVVEQKIATPINSSIFNATIFRGPLLLPKGKNYKVFDITGRVVLPQNIRPGVYFIEIDGKITRKVVKIR